MLKNDLQVPHIHHLIEGIRAGRLPFSMLVPILLLFLAILDPEGTKGKLMEEVKIHRLEYKILSIVTNFYY